MNSPAMGGGVLATMQGAYPHTTKLIESFTHNLKRLKGSLYNIDRKINDVNTELSKLKVDYAEAQKIVAEPFPQAQELSDQGSRLKTLTAELNKAAMEAKKKPNLKKKPDYFERAKLKKEAMRISKKILIRVRISPKIRISNKYVNSYLIKSSSCFCNFTYILLSVLA